MEAECALKVELGNWTEHVALEVAGWRYLVDGLSGSLG